MMSLMEAALATGGTALHGNPRIEGVSTDSRTIASGELFVALKGENFDGHAFVEAAAARGAAAAMVEREWADAHAPGLPLLAVADTRLALGALGAWWRGRFELPLIGVTGSNGKTTVKEMTAAILRAQARSDGLDPALAVLATQGNLNNDIGLPQMLLRLHASHRAAVIEMGMNHPGEIAYLTRLAQPTVALVNNAQRAHLAGLGGVAEVARAKGEIFEGLREGGTAVINADDAFAGLWREMSAGRRTLTFGLEQPADVCGRAEAKAFGSALAIETRVREAAEASGEPRPVQSFTAGVFGDDASAATGLVPAPTRDLIGLRTHQVYSPRHTYEHTYLNSQRYAWQCLVGVQRGQGDVDLASYYRFAENRYVFAFREFLIPVASVFFFDFERMRSTGKFLGITGDGTIANNPAGAFLRKVSMTFYPSEAQPV